jgi:aminoglycoside phosphotransferase (APT) family kinase protein
MSETSKKDAQRQPEDLVLLIRSSFPDLDWKTYKYNDEGWDHQVIILDNGVVFRFPNSEYLSSLKNEIEVLRVLNPLVNLKIPNYTYIAKDFNFAGYPIVPGQPLQKKLFDELGTSNQETIAEQLATFLSTLHTVVEKGYDFSSIELSDMKEQQIRLWSQSVKYLKTKISDEDFSLATEMLTATDRMLSQQHSSVFIHGDIYNNHLLWDEKTKQLGLIDFSDMNIGDPASDFAELFEYGEDFVQDIYDQYSGPKDNDFLQRAWIYQRWVGVFMMVDNFISHRNSFEEARELFDRVKHHRVSL